MSDELMGLLEREATTPVPPVDVDTLRRRGRRRRRCKQAAAGAAATVAVVVAVPALSAWLPSAPVGPIEPVASDPSPAPASPSDERGGATLDDIVAALHAGDRVPYLDEERFGRALDGRQDELCSWAAAQLEGATGDPYHVLHEALRGTVSTGFGDGFPIVVLATCGLVAPPDYPRGWHELPPYTWGEAWQEPPTRADPDQWLIDVEAAALGCEPTDLDGDGDTDCPGPVSGNHPWTAEDFDRAVELVEPDHAAAAQPDAAPSTRHEIVFELLIPSWEASRDSLQHPTRPGPSW